MQYRRYATSEHLCEAGADHGRSHADATRTAGFTCRRTSAEGPAFRGVHACSASRCLVYGRLTVLAANALAIAPQRSVIRMPCRQVADMAEIINGDFAVAMADLPVVITNAVAVAA